MTIHAHAHTQSRFQSSTLTHFHFSRSKCTLVLNQPQIKTSNAGIKARDLALQPLYNIAALQSLNQPARKYPRVVSLL